MYFGGDLRHFWLGILVGTMMLAACGGNDSDFASRPDGKESSSGISPKSSDSETSVFAGTMTDPRDGQTYRTVKIGNQVWMAENLNYETANSYCYKDSVSKCTKYGRLYTWAAAKTACPSGWHLPTEIEFKELVATVGGSSTAGKMLKSTSGWDDDEGESGNGTDAYLFTALPAGDRSDNGGIYRDEGLYAFFWGSTDDGIAYSMNLHYHDDIAGLGYGHKDTGHSVRCIKGLEVKKRTTLVGIFISFCQCIMWCLKYVF